MAISDFASAAVAMQWFAVAKSGTAACEPEAMSAPVHSYDSSPLSKIMSATADAGSEYSGRHVTSSAHSAAAGFEIWSAALAAALRKRCDNCATVNGTASEVSPDGGSYATTTESPDTISLQNSPSP